MVPTVHMTTYNVNPDLPSEPNLNRYDTGVFWKGSAWVTMLALYSKSSTSVYRRLIPVWKSTAEKVLDTIHKCTSFQLKKWRSAHPHEPVGTSPYYPSSRVFLRLSKFGFEFSPVKGTLAVLKWILLSVFAKHFGSHCLKHMTVQQCLAHTHHFWPRHTCTYNLNQTSVSSFKKNKQIKNWFVRC